MLEVLVNGCNGKMGQVVCDLVEKDEDLLLKCGFDKEKDMIIKHMWPVTLAVPKYKETFIITLVDKYFAVAEAFIKIRSQNEKIKQEKEKITR